MAVPRCQNRDGGGTSHRLRQASTAIVARQLRIKGNNYYGNETSGEVACEAQQTEGKPLLGGVRTDSRKKALHERLVQAQGKVSSVDQLPKDRREGSSSELKGRYPFTYFQQFTSGIKELAKW